MATTKQRTVTTGTVPATNRFAFTTTNKFNGLDNDTPGEYGNYKSSWMLDTAASGNYADKDTLVGNKKEIRHGVSVSCTNNGIMQQKAEGELPFNNILDGAKDVQIFKKMQKPLISGGKLVTNEANIVFNVPNAHVLTGETKEVIRKIIQTAEAENKKDILMTVSFDRDTLLWQIDKAKQVPVPKHVANNVHQRQSKQVLVDFVYCAAGYPMKKT